MSVPRRNTDELEEEARSYDASEYPIYSFTDIEAAEPRTADVMRVANARVRAAEARANAERDRANAQTALASAQAARADAERDRADAERELVDRAGVRPSPMWARLAFGLAPAIVGGMPVMEPPSYVIKQRDVEVANALRRHSLSGGEVRRLDRKAAVRHEEDAEDDDDDEDDDGEDDGDAGQAALEDVGERSDSRALAEVFATTMRAVDLNSDVNGMSDKEKKTARGKQVLKVAAAENKKAEEAYEALFHLAEPASAVRPTKSDEVRVLYEGDRRAVKPSFEMTVREVHLPRPRRATPFDLRAEITAAGDPLHGATLARKVYARSETHPIQVSWSEANVRAVFLDPVIQALVDCLKECTPAQVPRGLVARVEKTLDFAGLIPDMTMFNLLAEHFDTDTCNDIYACLVGEFKPPYKYAHLVVYLKRAIGAVAGKIYKRKGKDHVRSNELPRNGLERGKHEYIWVREFGVPEDWDVVNNSLAGYYMAFEHKERSVLGNQSPVAQLYTYMCALRLRYGILSTGALTWFVRRKEATVGGEGEELEISQTFRADEAAEEGKPSLAQALVYFIKLAVEGGVMEAPDAFKDQINRVRLVMAAKRKEAAAKRKEGAALLATAQQASKRLSGSRSSQSNKRASRERRGAAGGPSSGRGGDDMGDLPLSEVDAPMTPGGIRGSFGTLSHGVAHRLDVHGFDSVVKIVDASKDLRGVERLRDEADRYLALQDLWGVAVPGLVCHGTDPLNRYMLLTTYAGMTLHDAGKMCSAQVHAQARQAVERMHAAGYTHGNVGVRNVAVDRAGKVLLIGLADARRLGADMTGPEILEAQRADLAAVDALNTDLTHVDFYEDMDVSDEA